MNIKPCPFCGGKRPAVMSRPGDPQGQSEEWVFVCCTRLKCMAHGPEFVRYAAHQTPDPEARAADAWNVRAAA